jgi:hypothetical protein
MYYLTHDQENQCYVFTAEDPRKDGFDGPVQEGVRLEVPDNLQHFPPGVTAPHPCLAVSETDPRHYRVFKYRNECRPAGFRPVTLLYDVEPTWSKYRAGLTPA